jgi:hypothetical protein
VRGDNGCGAGLSRSKVKRQRDQTRRARREARRPAAGVRQVARSMTPGRPSACKTRSAGNRRRSRTQPVQLAPTRSLRTVGTAQGARDDAGVGPGSGRGEQQRLVGYRTPVLRRSGGSGEAPGGRRNPQRVPTLGSSTPAIARDRRLGDRYARAASTWPNKAQRGADAPTVIDPCTGPRRRAPELPPRRSRQKPRWSQPGRFTTSPE